MAESVPSGSRPGPGARLLREQQGQEPSFAVSPDMPGTEPGSNPGTFTGDVGCPGSSFTCTKCSPPAKLLERRLPRCSENDAGTEWKFSLRNKLLGSAVSQQAVSAFSSLLFVFFN